MLVNLTVQTARNKHRVFVFNARFDGADKALYEIFKQDEDQLYSMKDNKL